MSETTRRTVLAGAAGISAAVALAACGNDGEQAADTAASAGADAASKGASAAAGALAAVADIPVGGGKIFADQRVVLTQPTTGNIKAFSAICTHMQCAVAKVEDGLIKCPCHGSTYKIADGSVATGPATKPLPAATVKVEDGKINLG